MSGSQMKTFRVNVTRVVRDCQWRSVEVEAYHLGDAEAAALALADDELFWDASEIKTHPLESEEPMIDDFIGTQEVERDPDYMRDDHYEECRADCERTGRF